MNKVIHRDWGDNFLGLIYETQEIEPLWKTRVLFCQSLFLGISLG